MLEKVLHLYRERYFDFNFREKLVEEHGIKLSYTWVKLALQGAGVVAKRRKRAKHRRRREWRPLPGMLHCVTQVGRALRELGIKMIPAHSPQARPPLRIEPRSRIAVSSCIEPTAAAGERYG
jgi:hypothetical protein